MLGAVCLVWCGLMSVLSYSLSIWVLSRLHSAVTVSSKLTIFMECRYVDISSLLRCACNSVRNFAACRSVRLKVLGIRGDSLQVKWQVLSTFVYRVAKMKT